MELILTNPDTYTKLAEQLESESSSHRDPFIILEEIEEESGCALIFLVLR